MRPQRQLDTLLEQPVPWLGRSSRQSAIVLSSRLRISRNIQTFPFPAKADVAQRRELQLRIADAIGRVPAFTDCLQFDLTAMNQVDQQVLLERQLLDILPSEETEGVSLCVSQDESISLVTNDLDHLRLSLVRPDLDLEQLWQQADEADTRLGETLPWVFDQRLGHLTARPQDVGNAMFASIVMHLPGLSLADRLDQVANALSHMGFIMTGLIAEDGQTVGNLFEIGNQSALGEPEATLVRRLERVASDLIVQEKHARQSLLEQRPELIFDYVGRSYGALRHAWVMTSMEALALLAALRLGIELGMIETIEPEQLDPLFIRTQPAHLQRISDRAIDEQERDIDRARWLRQWLALSGKEAPGKG